VVRLGQNTTQDGDPWAGFRSLSGGSSLISTSEHGTFASGTYQHAVPIDMLKRAAEIKQRFGDEVEFYVSDYAVVDPDPFIMVKRGNCSGIVFGIWNEPGFDAEAK